MMWIRSLRWMGLLLLLLAANPPFACAQGGGVIGPGGKDITKAEVEEDLLGFLQNLIRVLREAGVGAALRAQEDILRRRFEGSVVNGRALIDAARTEQELDQARIKILFDFWRDVLRSGPWNAFLNAPRHGCPLEVSDGVLFTHQVEARTLVLNLNHRWDNASPAIILLRYARVDLTIGADHSSAYVELPRITSSEASSTGVENLEFGFPPVGAVAYYDATNVVVGIDQVCLDASSSTAGTTVRG